MRSKGTLERYLVKCVLLRQGDVGRRKKLRSCFWGGMGWELRCNNFNVRGALGKRWRHFGKEE